MKAKTKSIVLTSKGVINKSVSNIISNCRFYSKELKIYTGYYTGRGRFTSSYSAQSTVIEILKAQGYKFETGNDAPRGGVNGEFVKVSRVAFDFIQSIK